LAVMPATLMCILIGTTLISRFSDKRGLKAAVVVTAAAVLTCFALWPALWTHPYATLVSMLKQSENLARHGHAHWFDGERSQDRGVAFYLRWVLRVTPYETGLLALAGVLALAILPQRGKHYWWLSVSLLAYLVFIAATPKKLTRYALPAAALLVLLAGAGVEWLTPRLQGWLRRLPYAVTVMLGLLLTARFARAARILPSASACVAWPGVECERPPNMYFTRGLALLIQQDWQRRGRPRMPRVYDGKPRVDPMVAAALGCRCDELMAPWLRALKARSPAQANYVVLWDSDYEDLDAGRLTADVPKRFKGLGPELMRVLYDDRMVARLFRARVPQKNRAAASATTRDVQSAPGAGGAAP